MAKKRSWIDRLIYRITKKPKCYKEVKNSPKTVADKLLHPQDARQVQYNNWCKAKKKSKSPKLVKSTPNISISDFELFKKKNRIMSHKQSYKETKDRQIEREVLSSKSLIDKHLLKDLEKRKIKFTKKDVLFITKDKTGQIVWLEKGDLSAGWQHIETRHSGDFFDKHGIHKDKLINHLEKIFKKGKIAYSRTVMRKGRECLEKLYYYKGKYYLLSGIGSNGFIVSGYPLDENTAKRLIERYK